MGYKSWTMTGDSATGTCSLLNKATSCAVLKTTQGGTTRTKTEEKFLRQLAQVNIFRNWHPLEDGKSSIGEKNHGGNYPRCK